MRMLVTALLGTPDSLEAPSNNINGVLLGIALSPPDVIGVRLNPTTFTSHHTPTSMISNIRLLRI
jgi:hypothetical protein